ncbi:membrane-bound metal-dependent hydrolase [Natrialba hulunbeirensis JCM 10989]|uniref:Membrane-bound metal-dependent hydrolase n=1 Tax=Natrialba hulunbeirensis JCM 10989 TaxID=1227493 RepID=M0A5X0_9EURY|nr:metal-dependent hydrolase [Natrialba hulunbeirensis]ELY94135.1 membrane-bound metal-dependent hydrolase [Natrialba hulunbeirensis JCM 10989]
MYQVGHYGAALLVYAPLGTAVAVGGYEGLALIGGVITVALSTLPDFDQQVPLIDHRGPTHTVGFALLVGILVATAAALLVGQSSPFVGLGLIAFAFTVGTLAIVSHLLADVLTPMGIRPFWPLSGRHYTLDLTRAANPVANYVLFGLGVGAIVCAVGVVAMIG